MYVSEERDETAKKNDHQCLELSHYHGYTYLSGSLALLIQMAQLLIYATLSQGLHIGEDAFFSLPSCCHLSTWDYADSGLNLFILFCKCSV